MKSFIFPFLSWQMLITIRRWQNVSSSVVTKRFFFRSCLLNFLRHIFAKVCDNRLQRAVHKMLQIAKKGYPVLLRKLLKNSQKF